MATSGKWRYLAVGVIVAGAMAGGGGSTAAIASVGACPTVLQTYENNDLLHVPDFVLTESYITVSDSYVIADLDVQLDILHHYDEDLDVYLIGPDGTRVELFTSVGGSGNNFTNTVLDDEAATSIVDGSAPFSGLYQPEGSLSDFDGRDVTGVWTLELYDKYQDWEGTLEHWELRITPEPASLAMLVMGGLALIRRRHGRPSAAHRQ